MPRSHLVVKPFEFRLKHDKLSAEIRIRDKIKNEPHSFPVPTPAYACLALNMRVRRLRSGVFSYPTIADIQAGGNQAGDVLNLAGKYISQPDGITAIVVDGTVSGQANPAGGPSNFLATIFDNHCVTFNDSNDNGLYEPSAGELIYDGAYEHAAGSQNRLGYTSLLQLENAAIRFYRYKWEFTVLTVNSQG